MHWNEKDFLIYSSRILHVNFILYIDILIVLRIWYNSVLLIVNVINFFSDTDNSSYDDKVLRI